MSPKPGSPQHAESLLNSRFKSHLPWIVKDAGLPLQDWPGNPDLSWQDSNALTVLDFACSQLEERLAEPEVRSESARNSYRIAASLRQCIDAVRSAGLEIAAPYVSLMLMTLPEPAKE